MLGFIFGAALFDAAALTTAGIAGRGYGARDAMRGGRGSGRRRREMLGAGVALAVIGGATTLGATFMPLLVGTTDAFDYPMIGVRQSGVLIGGAGGFLLAYAVVLPRRRVVVRPTVSATQLGVVMRW
jgi:hypothetical protein